MTDKLIATDGTSSGLSAGAAISDTDYIELQQSVVSPASTVNSQFSAIKTWIKSWIAKADVGLGSVTNAAQLTIANNLSDVASAITSRSNLGAGAKFMKGYVSGRYYLPVGYGNSGTVTISSANVIRFIPVIFPEACTLSALEVRTVTGAAGNWQGAVYASDANSKPTGTALVSSASFSTAGNNTNVDAAVSLAVTAGTLYFFAFNTDTATPTYSGFPSTTGPLSAQILGSTTNTSVLGGGLSGYTFATTFNTWPDMTSQTVVDGGASFTPVMAFKVA